MKHKAGLQKRVSSIFGDSSNGENQGYPIDKNLDSHDFADNSSNKGKMNYIKDELPNDQGRSNLKSKQQLNSNKLKSSGKVKVITEEDLAKQSKVRQYSMFILVVILSVVLVFVVSDNFALIHNDHRTHAGVSVSEEIPSVNIDWELPRELPTKIRDITNKISISNGSDSDFAIRGIIYSEDKASVIIGSKIYGEGDFVNDARIVNIEHHHVEFERKGETWKQKVESRK